MVTPAVFAQVLAKQVFLGDLGVTPVPSVRHRYSLGGRQAAATFPSE